MRPIASSSSACCCSPIEKAPRGGTNNQLNASADTIVAPTDNHAGSQSAASTDVSTNVSARLAKSRCLSSNIIATQPTPQITEPRM